MKICLERESLLPILNRCAANLVLVNSDLKVRHDAPWRVAASNALDLILQDVLDARRVVLQASESRPDSDSNGENNRSLREQILKSIRKIPID